MHDTSSSDGWIARFFRATPTMMGVIVRPGRDPRGIAVMRSPGGQRSQEQPARRLPERGSPLVWAERHAPTWFSCSRTRMLTGRTIGNSSFPGDTAEPSCLNARERWDYYLARLTGCCRQRHHTMVPKWSYRQVQHHHTMVLLSDSVQASRDQRRDRNPVVTDRQR